ncbi:MAG TPA: mobile mystery protein A [Chitinophagaceae bacterium]|nr:mobile mystery protein A [Chitinophagaceae bacterium]
MSKKSLRFQQLNDKMLLLLRFRKIVAPPTGWIKAIRMAIGMSLPQLGQKLSVSKQAVADIEKREKDGTITIKALKEVAASLNMQLVYGFVPNDGSLEKMVEQRANELATQIVLRTANTMKLEDQANSEKRIKKAIRERTEALINEMPKFLWD